MRPHDWRPRRSLFFIEAELRRMRRNRIRMLRQRLPPVPAEVYADQAIALMTEAIDQDPVPVPTDWAALALDPEAEEVVSPSCDGRQCGGLPHE